MGKGSLGLYRQHDNPSKKWLAVRNLTGKVVLTVGVVPQMTFSAMEKAGSVAFACRPIFGAFWRGVGGLGVEDGGEECGT